MQLLVLRRRHALETGYDFSLCTVGFTVEFRVDVNPLALNAAFQNQPIPGPQSTVDRQPSPNRMTLPSIGCSEFCRYAVGTFGVPPLGGSGSSRTVLDLNTTTVVVPR